MTDRKRDYSLDLLRIIACVMVVGIHTAMEGWYNISPRTYTWTVLNFYDTLFRPGVPLFIMISGSLFLPKDQSDFKRLWGKNILRLGIIYAVWVVFYAVMNTGVKKALAEPKLIWDIISGPNPQYHLWYLRTLINLYAIAPLLRLLVRSMDKRYFRYFLILFAIFGLLRSTVYELPFLPAWLHEQINLFSGMDLVGYAAYFMLGYFLSEGSFSNISRKTLWAVYLITLFAAAGLNQWIAAADDWPTQALYGNFAIPVAIESVCLFLLVRKNQKTDALSEKTKHLLVRISESTLFVYLIHPFVIQRLQIYLNLYTINYNVLFSVPLMVILVFVLSSITGMLLKRVPVLNKIL